MRNKKVLISLAVIVALIVPFSVFAATSDNPTAKAVKGFFGIDTSKLTDKQKADLTTSINKIAAAQKDAINSMVANGTMTKEQGDAAIKRIDDMAKNQQINGFINGAGMKKGGFDKREDMGLFGLDISKLTDAQKSDLTDSAKKMADLQKETIKKMVANGALTKTQGDAATKKIDALLNTQQTNGAIKGFGMGKGGFIGLEKLGLYGIDTSKLTDKQKTDLIDSLKKMADLQKETISKMVSNGALTKDQGDAAITKIDAMVKDLQDNGLPTKNFGMKKGGFRGHGMRSDFGKNKATNQQSTTTTPVPVS